MVKNATMAYGHSTGAPLHCIPVDLKKQKRNLVEKTLDYPKNLKANNNLLHKTNVASPQTCLICVLITGLRPFSLLSDLLASKMDLNFRAEN